MTADGHPTRSQPADSCPRDSHGRRHPAVPERPGQLEISGRPAMAAAVRAVCAGQRANG